MTHTPGPWEYSGGGIWGRSPWNARVRLADITFHNSINGIASDANGQLMAAAPILLDAAKTALAFAEYELELRKPSCDPEYIKYAQTAVDELTAAIARAGA